MICEICGKNFGGGVEPIHKGTRDKEYIDVYECPQCGTKFLYDNGSGNDNNYEAGFMYATNNLSTMAIEERLKLFEADDVRRYHRTKDLCSGKQVLDFGCGFGGFLQNMQRSAASVSGVDLGHDEREYLSGKGFKCTKTIDEYNEKFDVITLFHTFEHLPEPRMWLNKFSEYLNKGGILIMEVPNANDALLSLYKCEKFADFTYWSAHLFLYTEEGLEKVIEDTGKYEIISKEQIQRYSVANHLKWLAAGEPGGHNSWSFMDSEPLNRAYAEKLAELKMCDTLFFILRLK